jgi:plasmid stabilization system protein ParE
MNYSIHITRAAERDLSGAADYIEYVLLNPVAADSLLDEAEAKIGELSVLPEKFSLVEDPVLKAWGIRYTLIKNYLAFYIISEVNRSVYIVRFLYNKREWIGILRQGFVLE